jgi:Co/Zn/Cd efflux system component
MFIISVAGVCFNVLVALALGVHAHLGHSHGPGGCSGHDHGHGSGHGHSHEHEHDHSHGGCKSGKHDHKHDHGHDHKHGHDHSSHGGCGSAHKHTHSHDHSSHDHSSHDHSGHDHSHHDHSNHSNGTAPAAGKCCGHSHSSSSSGSSSAADESSKPLLADQQGANGTAPAAAWTAAEWAAKPDAAGQPCIVIDLPATAANCGLEGHAVTCRCTIARTGSHEIEVRCELPAPAAAAIKPGSRPGTSHGHSHEHGHGHGHSHEASSINLRSAVLHVIGDILQSIGVAIAGALIWYNQDDPRWYLADPICTFIFSIVVLLTTKSIIKDIVHVLMERTPTNINIPAMSQVRRGAGLSCADCVDCHRVRVPRSFDAASHAAWPYNDLA